MDYDNETELFFFCYLINYFDFNILVSYIFEGINNQPLLSDLMTYPFEFLENCLVLHPTIRKKQSTDLVEYKKHFRFVLYIDLLKYISKPFWKIFCYTCQCWRSALFFGWIAEPDPLKIRADSGSRIADLAPSDIRRILQIKSIFQGGMKLIELQF